jgi:hypothetical protein
MDVSTDHKKCICGFRRKFKVLRVLPLLRVRVEKFWCYVLPMKDDRQTTNFRYVRMHYAI